MSSSATGRRVRVAPSFFDRLDELLPEERSAAGVASTADFLLHEMPALIDLLAVDYEAATLEVEGVPGGPRVDRHGGAVPVEGHVHGHAFASQAQGYHLGHYLLVLPTSTRTGLRVPMAG